MGATSGNDVLVTSGEYQTLHGLGGNDILTTNHFSTYLYGDNGNDELIADISDTDIVYVFQSGGAGDDILRGDLTSTDLGINLRQEGGSGDDTFEAYVHTTASPYTALYYIGNVIYAGHGNDTISAIATLDGTEGTASNFIYGEGGNDRIIASASAGVGVYHAFNGLASNTIDAGSGDDYIAAYINGANTNSEVIFNSIEGGSGNDEIHAQIGTGGGESSQGTKQDVWAGSGNDKVYVRASGGSNNITLSSDIMVDGGSGNDFILAESHKSSADWDLYGGASFDHTLLGGDGRDEIHSTISSGWGGSLNTLIDGGSGGDIMSASVSLIDNSGGYGGYVNTVMDGGDGADIISAKVDMAPEYWGASASFYILNHISGGQANDILEAEISLHIPDDDYSRFDTVDLRGNVLDGGSGNDTLTGKVVIERLSELSISVASKLYGGAGHDQLTVIGGTNNVLDGAEGNDTLLGGVGDDTLLGGLGRDLLTGGLGADTFVFAEIQSSYWTDTVTDFQSGTDIIQLSAEVFKALSGTETGDLLQGQLVYGTQADTVNQHLIYDTVRARFKSSSSVTVPCSSADEHADRSDHSPGG